MFFDFHDLSRFKDIEKFEIAVRHAIRIGKKFDDDAVTVHRRKLLVERENPSNPFEEFFWMQVILYEEVLSESSTKRTNVKAMKTRQALNTITIQEFLVQLMRKNKTKGLRLLEDANREDAAYENVIIKFNERFLETPDVIEIAYERLRSRGKLS